MFLPYEYFDYGDWDLNGSCGNRDSGLCSVTEVAQQAAEGDRLSVAPPSKRTSRRRAYLVPTAVLAAGFFLSPSAHALKGDANGDGRVDIQDARLVADYLVGNTLFLPQPADADVNGDGRVSTGDALLILQFSKGLRTSFDFQAPQVLTVLPANGATKVLLAANVSVFFSEPVSMASLNGAVTLRDAASGLLIPGRIERAQDGVIATFFPNQPLDPLKTYRVDVSTAVKDEEDNRLQQPFSSTFQTQPLGVGILVSTNNLAAPINELAPQPIAFKALDSLGAPVKLAPVTFTVRMGSGFFEPSGQRQVTVLTRDDGIAQVSFRIGGEAIENNIELSAIGFSTVPQMRILAQSLTASNLRVYGGDSQSGSPGTMPPLPLVVQATDSGGNPVVGTQVSFGVLQGDGTFAGQPTQVVPTDSSGTAAASFTFGVTTGPIRVAASFPGMLGNAPVFSLLNILPRPSSPTVITGRVVDAVSLKPLRQVYVYLADNPTVWDWTTELGFFRLAAAPGAHVVEVDGFESGEIGGNRYPVVAIPVNAVEGQDNEIGMPILLPPLEAQSFIDVSDMQGGTLTLRSDPRWKLYVAPGQARFANGTGTGRLYVAAVEPEQIPMPPAGGKISRFFDTIQPLNVRFDPPAEVTFPNSDNLPPGTVTDIYTLSYSSGIFLRTGRGLVAEDGSEIRSLPGEGITQGGWHQSPPPEPPPDTTSQGDAPSCNSTILQCGKATNFSPPRWSLPGVPAIPGCGSPVLSCNQIRKDPLPDDEKIPDEFNKKRCFDTIDVAVICTLATPQALARIIRMCMYICPEGESLLDVWPWFDIDDVDDGSGNCKQVIEKVTKKIVEVECPKE